MEIDSYYYSATRIVEVMQEGKTGARLCECDDGKRYVIKTLDEMPAYELIAEWICGHLAIAFGLPAPSCKLVIGMPYLIKFGGGICNQENDSVGFASGYKDHSVTLNMQAASEVSPQLKADLLVFDAWIKNGDRTLSEKGGNVNLLQDILDEQQIWVFDHNQALKADEDLGKLATLHVFSGANAGIDLDDLVTRLQYIERMEYCVAQLPQITHTLPQSWVELADGRMTDGKQVIKDIISPILNRYNDPDFWSWITP